MMSKENFWNRIAIILLLIWELIRTGFVWDLMSVKLGTGEYPFLLLWFSVPYLAIVAGYLMVLLEPRERKLHVLLLMTRGFFVIIALTSILTNLSMSILDSTKLESLYIITGLMIGDLVAVILQYILLKKSKTCEVQ